MDRHRDLVTLFREPQRVRLLFLNFEYMSEMFTGSSLA
jgi:hypothetical protein